MVCEAACKSVFRMHTRERGVGEQAGLLHQIPPGKRPFEVLHIDHLSQFIVLRCRNTHVFVTVNNFTKSVALFAVPDVGSMKVEQALNKLFLRVGLPEWLISDRGTGFTSVRFENFCKCQE